MGIVNYKCPNCRAGIGFDPSSGKFVCQYCQGVFTSEEMEAFTAGTEEEVFQGEKRADFNTEQFDNQREENFYEEQSAPKILPNMQLFSCPSCGAEIMTDSYTTASHCVYCGNNAIIASRLEGVNAPDYILPFEINKTRAIQIYENKIKKQDFIPKVFSSSATIEKITGVYVPTWLYSGAADMEMEANANIIRVHSGYKYTDYFTDEYIIQRNGTVIFEKVPIDASKKMDDNLMRAIEPFPYKDMLPFDMSYLSGFLADRFDENAEKRVFLAEQRMDEVGRYLTRKSVEKFEDLNYRSFHVRIRDMKYHYAYLPVWLLTVNFEGKLYHFAINGRKGTFAGRFPVSKSKVLKFALKKALLLAGAATILGAVLRAVLFFM